MGAASRLCLANRQSVDGGGLQLSGVG